MRRGTRVGQAYVSVTADGDGINEGIVDAVDDASDDVGKSGDRAGKEYGDRFSDRFRKRLDGIRDTVGTRLNKNLGDAGEDAGHVAGDRAGESFSRAMGDRIRTLGDKVGAQIGDRMASRPEQMRRGLSRAFDDDFADRIGTRFADRVGETIGDRMELIVASALDTIEDAGRRDRSVIPGRPQGRDEGFDPGRLFGAGSRNNALNLLGRSVGRLTKGMVGLFNIGRSTFSLFRKGFTEAADGANFFQKTLGGLSSVAGGLGTKISGFAAAAVRAGPAIVAAIAAAVAIMSVLASVISAVTALVTALASSIVTALVGSTIVLGGVVAAAAASVGLLVAGFKALDKEQKKVLTESFKPVKTALEDIGSLVAEGLVPAFEIWGENIATAVGYLRPLAEVMGGAFAEAGTRLTESLTSLSFIRVTRALAFELPAITNNLAGVFANLGEAMANVFTAVLPYVTQFTQYLEDVTGRFRDFTLSGRGQNSIKRFMDDALESVMSVWDATREFFGFVFDVMFNSQVQDAGNGMFDGIADSLANLRTWFKRVSEDGSLQRWLDDARTFAGDAKEAIKGLWKIFQALDNSGVLKAVGDALHFLGDALELIAPGVETVTTALGFQWRTSLALARGAIELTTSSFSALAGVLERVATAIRNLPSMPSVPKIGGGGGGGLLGLGGIGGSLLNGALGRRTAAPSTAATAAAETSGALAVARLAAARILPPDDDYTKPPDTDVVTQFNGPGTKTSGGSGSGGSGGGGSTTAAVKKSEDTAKKAKNSAKKIAAALRDIRKALAQAAKITGKDADLSSVRSNLNNFASTLRQSAKDAKIGKGAVSKAIDLTKEQKEVTKRNVRALLRGKRREDATLADFALARTRMAKRIEKARDLLANALDLRNSYNASVADSIRQFGDLTTAEASVVDGIQQDLSATDITGNLQDRLDQIRKFQENLRILVAQGLSDEAYKQLVDRGVEAGGEYAQALVDGSAGTVSDVNSLVSQIGQMADQLGLESSSRLYQAGVDAAKGLVDGLESMSDRLDKAAAKLGNRVAKAIQEALGLEVEGTGKSKKSGGGKNNKKSSDKAAARVATSRVAASYAAGTDVSGNGGNVYNTTIVTPTEDPVAVSKEVINEMVGRLP